MSLCAVRPIHSRISKAPTHPLNKVRVALQAGDGDGTTMDHKLSLSCNALEIEVHEIFVGVPDTSDTTTSLGTRRADPFVHRFSYTQVRRRTIS
jgi:hypothetical protein